MPVLRTEHQAYQSPNGPGKAKIKQAQEKGHRRRNTQDNCGQSLRFLPAGPGDFPQFTSGLANIPGHFI
jgi:hypothetical protein